jgi:mono/diheme cytochrome c family protein
MKKKAMMIGILATCLIPSWAVAQGWPGDPKNGKVLYERHCLGCHGAAGEGNGPNARALIVPPTNFQSQRSRLKTDIELLVTISHGVVYSPMHGWRGRLTDDEMWDVISYIRTMAPYSPYQ